MNYFLIWQFINLVNISEMRKTLVRSYTAKIFGLILFIYIIQL